MDHFNTAMQKGQAFRNLLIKDYFRLNISLDMLYNIYKISVMSTTLFLVVMVILMLTKEFFTTDFRLCFKNYVRRKLNTDR